MSVLIQLTKILQENEKTSIYPYFNYKNEWNCEKRRNFASRKLIVNSEK